MAVDVKKRVGAGFDSMWWAVADSAGYMQGAGSSTAAPAAGNQDGVAMAQLAGAKSFPFAPVQPDRPTATGDDGAIARFLFSPMDLPEATFTLAVGDMDFAAAAIATVAHNLGGGYFIPIQPPTPTFADLILLAVSQAKSQESGSSGAGLFECRLIMKANAYPRERASFEERATAVYEYDIIGNFADVYPWGLALSAGSNGCEQAVAMDFTWPYRPILQRWTGNNIEVTFNLAKNIAEDSADNIIVYVDGIAQTWKTGVPGAGEFGITEGATDTLVLGTAPGTNAKVVALYGWS